MRDNRSDSRGGFGGRSNRSGGRSEGRGNFRGRSENTRFRGDFEDRGGYNDRRGGRSERRPLEMHDVVCAKCGKDCQVPFKPTSDKPVFCNDCFKSESPRSERGSSSGISTEQFNQLNAKVDKILEILESITVEDEEEADEESEEEEK